MKSELHRQALLFASSIQEQKDYQFSTKKIIDPYIKDVFYYAKTNTQLEQMGIYFIFGMQNDCEGGGLGVLITKRLCSNTIPTYFDTQSFEPVIYNESLFMIEHLQEMFERCTLMDFLNYVTNISVESSLWSEDERPKQILSSKSIPTVPGGYWIDREVLKNPTYLPEKLREFAKNTLPLDLKGNVFVSDKLLEHGFYLYHDILTFEHFPEEYEAYLKEDPCESFTAGILTSNNLSYNLSRPPYIDVSKVLFENGQSEDDQKMLACKQLDFIDTGMSERTLLLIQLDENRTTIKHRYLLALDASVLQAIGVLHRIDEML